MYLIPSFLCVVRAQIFTFLLKWYLGYTLGFIWDLFGIYLGSRGLLGHWLGRRSAFSAVGRGRDRLTCSLGQKEAGVRNGSLL